MSETAKKGQVLIVEDESMIAMLLESLVTDLGYDVVVVAGTVDDGLKALDGDTIDVAILDINLRGKQSYEVADRLIDRNIPFIISTGYQEGTIDEPYRSRPVLAKPFRKDELAEALSKALS
jgi:CheY-like chemotaxis protein